MYHRVRRKMLLNVGAIILFISHTSLALPKLLEPTESTLSTSPFEDSNYESNVINFDEEYSVKFNKKYGTIPWNSNDKVAKDIHRYTVVKNDLSAKNSSNDKHETTTKAGTFNFTDITETTEETDYSVIPLELISTTESNLYSILDSTTQDELLVVPLSTTVKDLPFVDIEETITLPSSTPETEGTTENIVTTTSNFKSTTVIVQTTNSTYNANDTLVLSNVSKESNGTIKLVSTAKTLLSKTDVTSEMILQEDKGSFNITDIRINRTIHEDVFNNSKADNSSRISQDSVEENERDVPIFTELDALEEEAPEDYYDAKDVVPTTAPKVNALSVLVGFAGSVVESVAERVVPKGIYDLFKRMQKQSEALEAERLRSREENGGLGQFGRGILKSISSGLSRPLSQLMAGVRDIGSLDTDRGFVSNLASGVTSVASVANSVLDTFKDRVQAIYPGTVWCGDGHSPNARSGELGLFFFTDTCCRQHDACKLFIRAGETKYGLTNTGLFTRSHCSCDDKFRECLRRTSSLVSGQIGLTYFNVLGPQCFRKAHPIVRCARRTRITGQKCEEYELDYTKPKMWQWFDNETF